MLPNSPQRSKRRPLQFSVLALLITTTILGPLLGWYGPAAYSRLHEILAPEPITETPPLWVREKLFLVLGQNWWQLSPTGPKAMRTSSVGIDTRRAHTQANARISTRDFGD